jgi:hypothetical protein
MFNIHMLRVQYQAKSLSRRSNVIPTTRLHFYIRLELQLGCCEPLSWRLPSSRSSPSPTATKAPSCPNSFPSACICALLCCSTTRTTTANGRGRDAGGAGTHIVTDVSAAILRCGYIQLFTAVRRACVLDLPCAPCRPGFEVSGLVLS